MKKSNKRGVFPFNFVVTLLNFVQSSSESAPLPVWVGLIQEEDGEQGKEEIQGFV